MQLQVPGRNEIRNNGLFHLISVPPIRTPCRGYMFFIVIPLKNSKLKTACLPLKNSKIPSSKPFTPEEFQGSSTGGVRILNGIAQFQPGTCKFALDNFHLQEPPYWIEWDANKISHYFIPYQGRTKDFFTREAVRPICRKRSQISKE
jgi:hypothetical protein